ncbi:MAG: DUF2937 family protein [Bacteroidetes bacterium]|nr:MAG: DUF2937 family protein [Bacteroidota bacterium]
MSFLSKLFLPIGSLVDRLICVAFAVVLAQAPVYMAQYIDVLSGAQMEAGKVYEELSVAARAFDLEVDPYLDKLAENADPMVRSNAEVQQNSVRRYRRYTEALKALRDRSAWVRPFMLMRHYDPSIHAAMDFEPNVPLTIEGAVYAGLGVLLALMVMAFFKWLAGLIFRKRPTVYDAYEGKLPEKAASRSQTTSDPKA